MTFATDAYPCYVFQKAWYILQKNNQEYPGNERRTQSFSTTKEDKQTCPPTASVGMTNMFMFKEALVVPKHLSNYLH